MLNRNRWNSLTKFLFIVIQFIWNDLTENRAFFVCLFFSSYSYCSLSYGTMFTVSNSRKFLLTHQNLNINSLQRLYLSIEPVCFWISVRSVHLLILLVSCCTNRIMDYVHVTHFLNPHLFFYRKVDSGKWNHFVNAITSTASSIQMIRNRLHSDIGPGDGDRPLCSHGDAIKFWQIV